ncbi:MAG: hypothetical protein Q3M24_16455 [Candidatus Electrothrix aestuarii]|uniref:TrbC/VIRB2 family protein n=1 Tax=Candidatus Electrothrix aestuarii TaxID=3062594 RepID=A0AAU8LRG0_9BACT|nr:hypothetical protein [Candidatus Electrothrix aestuarii]
MFSMIQGIKKSLKVQGIKGSRSLRGSFFLSVMLVAFFAAVPAFATPPDWSTAIDWTAVATVISGLVLAAVASSAVLFGGFQGLKAAMSAFVQVVSRSFGR